MKINYPLYLYVFDQAGVVGLLEVTLQVEGTTDARVGDHWGEDLRAVDLLALTEADCYNMIFYMDDDNLVS